MAFTLQFFATANFPADLLYYDGLLTPPASPPPEIESDEDEPEPSYQQSPESFTIEEANALPAQITHPFSAVYDEAYASSDEIELKAGMKPGETNDTSYIDNVNDDDKEEKSTTSLAATESTSHSTIDIKESLYAATASSNNKGDDELLDDSGSSLKRKAEMNDDLEAASEEDNQESRVMPSRTLCIRTSVGKRRRVGFAEAEIQANIPSSEDSLNISPYDFTSDHQSPFSPFPLPELSANHPFPDIDDCDLLGQMDGQRCQACGLWNEPQFVRLEELHQWHQWVSGLCLCPRLD
ncbi:hypothetical protein BJ508DRAFT_377216 [Ascobolus immersus RN42]|uniref:Uncharacterized protein n=1 Tax=Ascobolus immersus RN42 TaxID=1160509 RepID=A0A3N4I3T2_ASCIM|nr:hypothetical protein BJ508DRAFT_377216 [Ascobolus immersus RN42]